MGHSPTCEYCSQQMHCRNLYVALKILEEELRFADRDELWREFGQLQRDLHEAGFAYPEGDQSCTLAGTSEDARQFVERAHALLRKLRRIISISPA